VIGATDFNLGMTIANNAANRFYKEVFTTDTEVDVTSPEALDFYLDKVMDSSPETGVDIVYCAGLNLLDAIADVAEVDLWNTFDVNVMGFIRLMRAIAQKFPRDINRFQKLENQQRVNVVAVASDAARTPMRRSISYCASKAALVQAVRVAARELAPYVRINAVSPAIIDGTPMTVSIDAEVERQRGWSMVQRLEYERSMIPMGRRAEGWEVAQLVLNTLEGPVFLTGSNIEITGGK
jgi:NAD(P)-dependent dehydrogenase (short-subunit alcohol dehydrogenase family)